MHKSIIALLVVILFGCTKDGETTQATEGTKRYIILPSGVGMRCDTVSVYTEHLVLKGCEGAGFPENLTCAHGVCFQ
jgi:hypothetical protein